MANDKVRFEFVGNSPDHEWTMGDKATLIGMIYQQAGPVIWVMKMDGRIVGAHPHQLRGLVSDDTNNSQVSNKSDTITIDRRVAELWVNKNPGGFDYGTPSESLHIEITKALSEGRVKE